MIDVSCILINYNTSTYTIDCVNSILDNTKDEVSFEIVIADNASKYEDYQILKLAIDQLDDSRVKLIRSRLNTGFGGGNMMGVNHASNCKYFAFINNDTLFESQHTLQRLVQFMKDNPAAGVCSPQMLDADKNFRRTIDHFSSLGREILKRSTLELINPKRYPNRKITYSNPLKVDYVQGAFMFVDAQAFKNVGGFDTNLFLYYEESDLCRRILKQEKLETYLVPDLEYIHYESASTTSNIYMKIEQKISLIYYTKKHYGWFSQKILLTYFSIRYFFSSLFKPKYWKLFFLLLKGMPLSKSLKQKQIELEA